MLPEINSIFKIIQRTTIKKNNQPNPLDPMIEYNNIFLRLITVSKIIPNNKKNEKTSRNKFLQNKNDQIISMNSYTNYNHNKQEIPLYNYPSIKINNHINNKNVNRYPLTLSIRKINNPLYHDNKISLGNNNLINNPSKNEKKVLRRTLANLEECMLNRSNNINRENSEKFKNYFQEQYKSNNKLIVFNSLNLYKNPEFQDSSQTNQINEKNNKKEENLKEKIINYVENKLNNEQNEDNQNKIVMRTRHLNFLNREKVKNSIAEENKTFSNTIFNSNKKIFDIKKNDKSRESKKIKILVPEKITPIQIINSLKNTFTTREQMKKKLNYTYIPFPLNQNINNPTNIFYYYINKLYRNQLTEYFNHRINWEYVSNENDPSFPTINFYWKYYSNKLHFKQFKHDSTLPMKRLKVVNLFERNYEIGNKKNLFINLIQYCDKVNLNVFDFVPFTIIIQTSKINDCFDSLNEIFQLIQNNSNIYNNGEKDFIVNKNYYDLFGFDKNFSELKNTPIYINKNFLSEKNYWILKPTDLYKGICIEISNNYEEIVKKCKKMFKGVDKTFLLENIEDEIDDEEEKNNNTIITNNINSNIDSNKTIESNLNITSNTNLNSNIIQNVKSNSNEINNSNSLLNINNINVNSTINQNQEIEEEELKKKKRNTMYISNSIVLQKYLDNPLLYQKRKFDMRCYVLVDSNLNVFFCREGHLKGSSEKYDLNNTNKFIHITNHSLQKRSNKFEKYEYGNEMSYNDFKTFLKSENISLDKFDGLINDMKFLIEISMNSIGKKFFKTENVLCFEVFGYDFIVDKNFKPWILEINNNPGLGISSPVIEKLVPRMFDDALRLTIDKIFDTRYDESCFDKENNKYISKYKLDGFNDNENVFEFLCNINNSN